MTIIDSMPKSKRIFIYIKRKKIWSFQAYTTGHDTRLIKVIFTVYGTHAIK